MGADGHLVCSRKLEAGQFIAEVASGHCLPGNSCQALSHGQARGQTPYRSPGSPPALGGGLGIWLPSFGDHGCSVGIFCRECLGFQGQGHSEFLAGWKAKGKAGANSFWGTCSVALNFPSMILH